jgi:hypothetical protein
MRLGPWIALKLTAGIAALALSVRGWHSPELTVAGGALLLRTGFDLARTRPTKAPPGSRFVELRLPRRLVGLGLAAAPLGRKAPRGSRRGPGATGALTRRSPLGPRLARRPTPTDQRHGGR